ncbi:hypothetical protein NLJ89_g7226 [Agrocybe chaxingu]|uniref:Uncharacterized protein n=1 Tax=Agrocybe chaxingu TaxID=84603 RepID=A0A9W8K409_9AGAR|nr:hypothetical protein NLJ89_g7226 [Agrocybe chaxingu]
MPIELPQMSNTCTVPVPNQPDDPPSVHDFGRAIRFGHDLVLGHLQGKVPETDLLSGSTYTTRMSLGAAERQQEQPAGVSEPPPWFTNAMRDLKNELIDEIRTAKHELKADIQILDHEVQKYGRVVTAVRSFSSVIASQKTGLTTSFYPQLHNQSSVAGDGGEVAGEL